MEEFLDCLCDHQLLKKVRDLISFYFSTYMYHTAELLSSALYDMLVCNFFFRELSTLLITGPAGFGPARGAILIEMDSVTVSLVTAVTNCSAMMPVAYLRSPWLRYR